MIIRSDYLEDIAASLESKAGTNNPGNNDNNRWRRIALAAEALAGVATTANVGETGYMLRAAKALETYKSITPSPLINVGDIGYLTRITQALEAGAAGSGSLSLRFRTAALAFVTSIPQLVAAVGTPALAITSSSYSNVTSLATFVVTYITGAGVTGRIDYSINSGAYTGTATIIANPSTGNATITVPINAALQGTSPTITLTLKNSVTGVIIGGGVTTLWSATDRAASYSGASSTTATASNTGADSLVRTTNGYSSGTRRFKISYVSGSTNIVMGLSTASVSTSNYLSQTTSSVGWYGNNAGGLTGGVFDLNYNYLEIEVNFATNIVKTYKDGVLTNGAGDTLPAAMQGVALYPTLDIAYGSTIVADFGLWDLNPVASTTVAITYAAMNATVGINASGIYDELPNDLMELSSLYVKRNSAYKIIAGPGITINEATSVSYADSTSPAIDANWFPTRTPYSASVTGYIATDNVLYGFNFSSVVPSQLVGTYDVTFTPGLTWVLANGGATLSLSNYNSAAGTATLTLSSTAGNNPQIELTSFAAAGSGYFKAIKQGSVAGKKFQTATKTSLGGLVSKNTNRGFIRFMDLFGTNRQATTGTTFGTRTGFRPVGAVGQLGFRENASLAHVIEACADTNTNPWINIPDTAHSTMVTAIAQYFFDNMPAGMKLAVEYSNEMWNFGAAFSQSTDLNTRATAAGVSQYVQYSREYKTKVLDPFEAVFGVNNAKLHPVLAWQAAGINSAVIASMLNENSIYTKIKGFAIGPYVGGGIAGKELGNYSEQSIFTQAQRDIVTTPTTGKASFKTNAFAAQTTMSNLVKAAWNTFANDLASYCVSKSLAYSAIRPATYEYQWQHILEANTPTASSQDVLTKQAFAEMLRDSRAGTAQNYQNDWLKQTGGDFVGYQHITAAGTTLPSYGSWGYCDAIGSEAQEPYASTAAWITANT